MKSSTRKKSIREAKAIHLYFAKGYTLEEIATEMEIAVSTASKYINSDPSEEVKRLIDEQAAQVRVNNVQHLREQFAEVVNRKEDAEDVQPVYRNEDGEVEMVSTDNGPVPKIQDFEIAPDHKTRAHCRREERGIMEHMETLVGAQEPQEVEVSGEGIVIDLGDDE